VTLSAPEIAPVQEGEILDGKYRVERVLGVGGMGVVVAATHVQLHTRVALKFLLPAALGNPQIVERFAREARAAVQIHSEHVARVTDVGTLPTGSPYMVMEYLEGGDLSDALTKGGRMPIAQAVSYVLQACEAIAEAHSLGIVHRDLKPANLFLARRPGRDSIVKVLDFGISKTNESGPSGLTQTSAMMGSPYYMAPEQMMSSKDVDARADIWALGVILYELLAGEPPFSADSMAEIVFQVTQRDAPPLQSKRPEIPPELGQAVACSLARDRALRFPNVAKLAAAIAPFGPPRSEISVERIVRVLGASAPPPADARPTMQTTMQATSSTWASSQERTGARPKTRRVVAVVAVAGALIGVGVVWLAVHGHSSAVRDDRPPATAALPPAQSAGPPPAGSAERSAEPSAVLAPLPESTAEPAKELATPVPAPKASATTAVAGHPAPTPARPRSAQPAAPTLSAPPSQPGPPSNRGLNMGMKE
jgi:eukaryotic-like serine/threonine-protein kinase